MASMYYEHCTECIPTSQQMIAGSYSHSLTTNTAVVLDFTVTSTGVEPALQYKCCQSSFSLRSTLFVDTHLQIS